MNQSKNIIPNDVSSEDKHHHDSQTTNSVGRNTLLGGIISTKSEENDSKHHPSILDVFASVVTRFPSPTQPLCFDTALERRVSCHRCGNIRKRKISCIHPSCPHIYCGRCADKMKEEHGNDIFKNGCPVCLELCCCSNKTLSCSRKNHCYRKCPASKAKSCANYEHHETALPSYLEVVEEDGSLKKRMRNSKVPPFGLNINRISNADASTYFADQAKSAAAALCSLTTEAQSNENEDATKPQFSVGVKSNNTSSANTNSNTNTNVNTNTNGIPNANSVYANMLAGNMKPSLKDMKRPQAPTSVPHMNSLPFMMMPNLAYPESKQAGFAEAKNSEVDHPQDAYSNLLLSAANTNNFGMMYPYGVHSSYLLNRMQFAKEMENHNSSDYMPCNFNPYMLGYPLAASSFPSGYLPQEMQSQLFSSQAYGYPLMNAQYRPFSMPLDSTVPCPNPNKN